MSKTLSSALHAARLALGLTRREVEDATGVRIKPIEERNARIDAKRFALVWHYLSTVRGGGPSVITDAEILRRARAAELVDIPYLAEGLLVARQIRGLSRRALAVASGVSERLVAAFEAGRKAPTHAQLAAVWDVLAADVAPVRFKMEDGR